MKTSCRFLPLLPAAALAACGSSTTASVQLDPHDGWAGTAEVLVHKPDGTMVSRTPITTSLDVAVDDGDTVTVAVHDAGKTALMSAAGIARGDLLELGVGPLGTTSFTSATVTLPQVSGATSWDLETPNSSSSGDATAATQSVDILTGTTSLPILATASGPTGVLAMYGEKNAAVTAGPAIAVTDQLQWTPVTVTPANAPTSGSTFTGGDVYVGDQGLGLTSTNGTLAVPTGFGDALELIALSFGQTEFDYAGQAYASAPTAPVSIDLSMPDLPQISAVTLASGKASWTLTSGGSYKVIGIDVGAASDDSFSWSIAAPPATASFVLPQLPADLAAPTFDTLSVGAYERSDLGGYDDVLHATGPIAAGAHFEERNVSMPTASGAAPKRGVHGKLPLRAGFAPLR